MKSSYLKYSESERAELEVLNAGYREFLDAGKTERECADEAVRLAQSYGFVDLNALLQEGNMLEPGDRVYSVNMGKGILLAVIGEEPMENGFNIVAAHIDSPRLDIKQNPLYEDGGLAFLDTHYYGGIKKYQWVTIPLAIHGVVVKKDGSTVKINIGEDEDDPVFCISDLLIHLSQDQLKKTGALVVEGEALNVLIGSEPLNDEDKDAVKENIINIIQEKYNFSEEDFISAELEVVPAGRAREMGLDRSMTLAYGQDDRSCAYPAIEAILGIEDIPSRTAICILADKEEIGSVGATGMEAKFFENTVAELMNAAQEYSELKLRRALRRSMMLSADVTAAFDPNYSDAFEKNNAAYLGAGISFSKYTGARGKSGSNDANAEYIAKIRRIMEEGNVYFQTSELGKVDKGGGGTIAFICSLYGMEVIDCGVPVLSMHAPFEITIKSDIYEEYKCYSSFFMSDGR